MIRQKLNDNWIFYKGNKSMMDMFSEENGSTCSVTLPHDAMILEERSPECANGSQTGFYPGGQYTYIRKINIPQNWCEKEIYLEFEGIAGFSRVYINENYAGGCLNSYRNFDVCMDHFLMYGKENEIKVEVNNPEQSSRWYSGSGIYRNVNLCIGNKVHLKMDDVKVITQNIINDMAFISVQSIIVNHDLRNHNLMLYVEIINCDGNIAGSDSIPVTIYSGNTEQINQNLAISNPDLWDDLNPNLYTCHVSIVENNDLVDEQSFFFGIRKINISALTGLLVNGREVKLRGTCIHHDNGVIGAVTLESAERRKCRQLKEAGFNCIRSSHHPVSKAMLDACDYYGMYVIDELSDMWTRTKNPNDYAQFFPEQWEQDVKSMVKKDFNHPSVIFYSTGNEIPEAGTKDGANWNRKIGNKLKELDASRFTTAGINGMLAGNSRMNEIMAQAMGMSPEQFAKRMMADSRKEENTSKNNANSEGANELNSMMSVLVGPLADGIAASTVLSDMIDEYTSAMDIAGYNYLTALHELEKNRHPNRVILGAETYPAEIARLWDIVKRNAHVIGDMTWTGYDYLGEAGCGVFHYDGTQNFSSHWPDKLAYIGDIDITGYRRPVSYFRECVFGLRKKPYIAVTRMDKAGQHYSKTPWMWKDNISSWTWPGYENEIADVDVYADADEVELLLNGESFGRQNVRETYMANYQIPYKPGELRAISYCDNIKAGEFKLSTVGKQTKLFVSIDKRTLKAGSADLAYVEMELQDENGNPDMWTSCKVRVEVEGEGYLQGMGNANPSNEQSYQLKECSTEDGKVLAVIRSGQNKGTITLHIHPEGLPEIVESITVR